MIATLRACSILLLLCAAVWANTSVGQPLSIIKNSATEFLITATAPDQNRYDLQGSKDVNLWLDINDAVSGTVSNLVNPGLSQCFFRLIPWTERPPITIVLVGDSTVADLTSDLGWFNGWGQGMYGYFKTNATVLNLARPGYGTKNWVGSDDEARMLALKPNYVLLELFYADEFGSPEVSTTLAEYAANLKTIVQRIRDFNGTPILLTPQAVRKYTPDDQLVEYYPARDAVVRQVAAEVHVSLIDLNTLSIDLMNKLGRSGSDDLWATTFQGEWLHFSAKGADVIAGLVVNSLSQGFGPYLRTDRILGF